MDPVSRREALLAALPVLLAAAPATKRLAFEVWRGGKKIGRHALAFDGDEANFRVTIDAQLAVGLGPITLFRYRHQALETWRGGRFAEITSHTVTNGKSEQLSAVAAADGVLVRSADGTRRLAPGALPLTHWNERALTAPLFNPQTGKTMRLSLVRQPRQTLAWPGRPPIPATRCALTGDADLVDWYDAAESWCGLSAKAQDGSQVDYRRVAA